MQFGYPEAHPEAEHLVVPFETEAADFVAQPLYVIPRCRQRGIDEQQAEFIAAQPCQVMVPAVRARPHDGWQALQQGVARTVSTGVVDQLESIQVDVAENAMPRLL